MLEEEILEEIDNEKDLQKNNEIVEVGDIQETLYDMKKIEVELNNEKKPKKKKDKRPSVISKIKNKWRSFSKKKKIIIIVITILILLLIGGLIVYFVILNDEEKKNKNKPVVIVEKENYRYESGTLVFLDDSGDELGTYECKNQDEDKCYIPMYSTEDDFDITTNVYTDYSKVALTSEILLENYVLIYDNKDKKDGNIILYDIKEKEELGTYKVVKKLNEESFILKDEEDKYGVISFDEDGSNENVEFKYSYIGYIEKSEAMVATENEQSFLIDLQGEVLTKSIEGDIKNYSDKYISVEVDDQYYLYDYEGQVVSELELSYITFVDSYVFVISNKKMYAYDTDLNPLNKDGIRMKEYNYRPMIIFNEELEEVDRKESFVITINSDTIDIDLGSYNETINIYEGTLSSLFAYVSYFEGKLYFYNDEAKANELGTYECSNKNVITKSTTEYTNCFVARESALLNRGTDTSNLGYLPIYNERYVFINDAKDGSNNIILWDLKSNSKKATYTEVDAGYYNNSNVINFVSTADHIVMAKTDDGGYVIVKIASDSISPVINSKNGKNESIKYLGSDFLVKRSAGYYLYDTKGTELAFSDIEIYEVGEKAIVGINSNKKYDVNTTDGKIMASGFDYVRMYNDYFVGITNKKINVYEYEVSSKGLIKEDVVITNNDYANSYSINGDFLVVDGKAYSLKGESSVTNENAETGEKEE